MTHADVTSAGRSGTASFLAEGRAHLGLELGSTRIKAALVDDRGTVLGTGSHAWENQLVEDSWTYSSRGSAPASRTATPRWCAMCRRATASSSRSWRAWGSPR